MMIHPRRERLRGLPFNRMIPNILTLLALCAGLSALRFGLQERWEHAVLAVLAAAILDGLDGRIARILKGASKFGAELDSLSDFICFGVAPSVLLYLWTMRDFDRFGWVLVLLFSVCCALRLARFNTQLDEPDQPAWTVNYFSGVPSPMGAGLVLAPMILSFEFGTDAFKSPIVVAAAIITISALLVSPIPTYSFTKMRVPHRWVLPVMLVVGLFAAALVSAPWSTMSACLAIYVATIPFSIRSYRRHKRIGSAASPTIAAAEKKDPAATPP